MLSYSERNLKHIQVTFRTPASLAWAKLLSFYLNMFWAKTGPRIGYNDDYLLSNKNVIFWKQKKIGHFLFNGEENEKTFSFMLKSK
jgi:hypothetical protein